MPDDRKKVAMDKFDGEILDYAIARMGTSVSLKGIKKNGPTTKRPSSEFDRMVWIQVMGKEVFYRLKFYFSMPTARVLFTEIFSDPEKAAVDRYPLANFKEWSNLLAGHVSNVLKNNGFQCRLSLPVALNRSMELEFVHHHISYHRAVFDLDINGHLVQLAHDLEIMTEEAFEHICKIDTSLGIAQPSSSTDEMPDIEFF